MQIQIVKIGIVEIFLNFFSESIILIIQLLSMRESKIFSCKHIVPLRKSELHCAFIPYIEQVKVLMDFLVAKQSHALYMSNGIARHEEEVIKV